MANHLLIPIAAHWLKSKDAVKPVGYGVSGNMSNPALTS